jgi:hypothetical protein
MTVEIQVMSHTDTKIFIESHGDPGCVFWLFVY